MQQVWLNRERLIVQLCWPNPFGDDAAGSTTGTQDKDRRIDLYMTDGYRKKAKALGIPMPPRGADENAVSLWQLRVGQLVLSSGIRKRGFEATALEGDFD